MDTRNPLIALIKSHESGLRLLGVQHLALFGSQARGDARAGSDLDVLIDLHQGDAGSDRITAGRAALEVSGTLSAITGLDVSLVERNQMPPNLAQRILDDIVEVF